MNCTPTSLKTAPCLRNEALLAGRGPHFSKLKDKQNKSSIGFSTHNFLQSRQISVIVIFTQSVKKVDFEQLSGRYLEKDFIFILSFMVFGIFLPKKKN